MTAKEKRMLQEVEDALDRKPKPLSALERINYKIKYLRRRRSVGVTIRLSHEEANALIAILPRYRSNDEDQWEVVAPFVDTQIPREVREWQLHQEKPRQGGTE